MCNTMDCPNFDHPPLCTECQWHKDEQAARMLELEAELQGWKDGRHPSQLLEGLSKAELEADCDTAKQLLSLATGTLKQQSEQLTQANAVKMVLAWVSAIMVNSYNEMRNDPMRVTAQDFIEQAEQQVKEQG